MDWDQDQTSVTVKDPLHPERNAYSLSVDPLLVFILVDCLVSDPTLVPSNGVFLVYGLLPSNPCRKAGVGHLESTTVRSAKETEIEGTQEGPQTLQKYS